MVYIFDIKIFYHKLKRSRCFTTFNLSALSLQWFLMTFNIRDFQMFELSWHLIFAAFYFEVAKKKISNFRDFLFPWQFLSLSKEKFDISCLRFIMDHKFQWPQQGLNCEHISYSIVLVITKLYCSLEFLVQFSLWSLLLLINNKFWVWRSY